MGFELVDVTSSGNIQYGILQTGDIVGLMVTPEVTGEFEEVTLPERLWAEVIETGKVLTAKVASDPLSRKLGVRRGTKLRFQTKHVWASIRRGYVKPS